MRTFKKNSTSNLFCVCRTVVGITVFVTIVTKHVNWLSRKIVEFWKSEGGKCISGSRKMQFIAAENRHPWLLQLLEAFNEQINDDKDDDDDDDDDNDDERLKMG